MSLPLILRTRVRTSCQGMTMFKQSWGKELGGFPTAAITNMSVIWVPHLRSSSSCPSQACIYLFTYLLTYLLIEGNGGKKGEKHQPVASPMRPNQEPNVQPRHVPWPGTEPVNFCSAGQQPTNWATQVRAPVKFLDDYSPSLHLITLSLRDQSQNLPDRSLSNSWITRLSKIVSKLPSFGVICYKALVTGI